MSVGVYKNRIFSLGHLTHRLGSGDDGSLAPIIPQTDPTRPSLDEGETLDGSQTSPASVKLTLTYPHLFGYLYLIHVAATRK